MNAERVISPRDSSRASSSAALSSTVTGWSTRSATAATLVAAGSADCVGVLDQADAVVAGQHFRRGVVPRRISSISPGGRTCGSRGRQGAVAL